MLTSPKATTAAASQLISPLNKEKILKQMTADKLTATQKHVLEMVRGHRLPVSPVFEIIFLDFEIIFLYINDMIEILTQSKFNHKRGRREE